MMDEMLVWTVPVSTTLAALALVSRVSRSGGRSLRYSLQLLLECIGACVVFVGANLCLGFVLVLLVRGLTGWFISLYDVSDSLLATFSILQGFVVQLWWRSAARV